MSEFSILSSDFNEGNEIPKEFGYKFENKEPNLDLKIFQKILKVLD